MELKDFETWFDSQEIEDYTNKKYMLAAYEAGAASRQAEVDELQERYRIKSEFLDDADAMIKYQDSVIDELKRELEILQGMNNAVSLTAGELVDEIDDLTKMLHASCDDGHYLFNRMNELKKRIDDAIEVFEEHDLNYIEQIEKVYGILKGEQNEP